MNIQPSEQLTVDPKDLECGICYSKYSPITNEPLIMIPCEHPICSSCFKNIEGFCPFCKGEILEKPIRNRLLSSLLERDSQVKKCPVHNQPLKRYSKEENKLFCSQCIEEKFEDKSESMDKIESRIKEIKNTEKNIHEKKEENKKEIREKLQKSSLNLKRKLDDLYDEKIASYLSHKKKLKRMIDTFIFSEKDHSEYQLLTQSKPEENARIHQENWKTNPEGSTAARILENPLFEKEAIQFYNQKAKQISKRLTDKEKSFEKIIADPRNSQCESSKSVFDSISEQFLNLNPNPKIDIKNCPEIARNYLLSTFDEYGFVVNYQPERDCLELQNGTSQTMIRKFYPEFFDCFAEKLRFSCLSVSDSKFPILCDMLGNVQGLSDLTLSLKTLCSCQLEKISNLVLKSKTLKKFSFDMPLCNETQNASKKYLDTLLRSNRILDFQVSFTPENLLIDFKQDLVRPFGTAFEQFSAKFIGESPLYAQVLPIMSSTLSKITALRTIKLYFGDFILYDAFLQKVIPMLRTSTNLQELDLGFSKVDLLQDYGLAEQISQLIIHSQTLKKVSLFLSGKELSRGVFNDLFYSKELNIPAGHQLEEFSLTIMGCDDADIFEVFKFLSKFLKLKKLTLRINRVDISFQEITRFLEKIPQINSLISFDFACRDFRQLTQNEKKELEIYKFRLSKYNIPHKIVFEQLESFHLPDYVNLLSENEDEENEEGNENQEGEGQEQEQQEEDEGGDEEIIEEDVREEFAPAAAE